MQEEEMLAEGLGQTSREQILDHVSTHGHLIHQYLNGTLTKPLLEDKPEKMVPRRKHRLGMVPRFVNLIAAGSKSVEGRLARGQSLQVEPGDLLLLGPLCVKVSEASHYSSVRDMLEAIGFEKFVPDVGSLEDAVSVYHSCLAEQQKIPAKVFRVKDTFDAFFCSKPQKDECRFPRICGPRSYLWGAGFSSRLA